MDNLEFRPVVGTALACNGCVVEHRRVIDSLSRWHGLISLVIEQDGAGYPEPEPWISMLQAGADVRAIVQSTTHVQRITILYKLVDAG